MAENPRQISAKVVLDPTCGSGSSAYVAEQWGRRWITIDTSRVALALARTRLMAARYPWYLLADSKEGRAKETELTRRPPPELPVRGDIRQGFVYERVPHITLKSIANNPQIDEIWERWQSTLHSTLEALNYATGEQWQEWQVPREITDGRETSLVNQRSNGTPLAARSAPKRDPFGRLVWTARDNQGETRCRACGGGRA